MKQTRHRRRAFGRLFQKLGNSTGIIRAADSPSFFRSWLAKILLREIPPKPQLQILPLKHIRLQQLADAGLNYVPFRFWLRGELDILELKDFFRKHGRISLRNFTEERILEQTPKLPVEFSKSNWDFISAYCIKHNKQYHTLVNEAVPLEDSLVSGNIILLDSKRYVVSCFEGYGTPRHVDDKKSSELKVYLSQFEAEAPVWVPKQLRTLIPQLQEFHRDFRPITFEFSIYPYPVGLLQRPEVFWEWRSGSTHDLYTIVSKLLERADSHELIFHLPLQKMAG